MDTPTNLSEMKSSGNSDGSLQNLLKVPNHFDNIEEWYSFFKNSKNNIFIIGLEGSFIKLNRSFEKLLGYTTEELLTEPIRKIIINPRNREPKDFLEIPTTDYYFNFCFRCKNGKVKLLRCRLIADVYDDCLFVIAWEIDPM
jgi:PAS domain S-box-containing protein